MCTYITQPAIPIRRGFQYLGRFEARFERALVLGYLDRKCSMSFGVTLTSEERHLSDLLVLLSGAEIPVPSGRIPSVIHVWRSVQCLLVFWLTNARAWTSSDLR